MANLKHSDPHVYTVLTLLKGITLYKEVIAIGQAYDLA